MPQRYTFCLRFIAGAVVAASIIAVTAGLVMRLSGEIA
jgi:hypothetical protein